MYSDLADYGYPGPEGPRFWGMIAVLAALLFLLIAAGDQLPGFLRGLAS